VVLGVEDNVGQGQGVEAGRLTRTRVTLSGPTPLHDDRGALANEATAGTWSAWALGGVSAQAGGCLAWSPSGVVWRELVDGAFVVWPGGAARCGAVRLRAGRASASSGNVCSTVAIVLVQSPQHAVVAPTQGDVTWDQSTAFATTLK